jgi:hexosaminidase
MSYDKLNVFHWHITDTHSFPLVSRRLPQLSQLGAYSPAKVYSAAAVREIVDYARVRGVRVLPEFDAPAHVGNGWQFANEEGQPRAVVCLNQEPWEEYCVEPPCGQFNPVSPAVYPLLGELYLDFFELFPDTDMFHMGGDEVNLNCWNASQEIKDYLAANGQTGTEDELVQLWNLFQVWRPVSPIG